MSKNISEVNVQEFKQNIQATTNFCQAICIYNKYFATQLNMCKHKRIVKRKISPKGNKIYIASFNMVSHTTSLS